MKKQKNAIFIVLGFLFAGVGFFIFLGTSTFNNKDNLLGRLQILFFDKNSITVTGENVNINNVTIECLAFSQGIVFEKGQTVAKIKNEYGTNAFEVFYEGKLIAMAWIFKTNWWHTHKHFFDISKTDSDFQFNFNVIGPDSESLGFKTFSVDSSAHTSTEMFYNTNGINGVVNVEYYNESWELVVDESWRNDTLVNLNLYQEGKWEINYNTNKSFQSKKHNLMKIDGKDSLTYVYQTIEDGTINEERVAIKQYNK